MRQSSQVDGAGAGSLSLQFSNVKVMDAECVLHQLRDVCVKRGATGIKQLGRSFRIYDRDRNSMLSYEEFESGLNKYNIDLSSAEVRMLFDHFDRDGNGVINFNEFLVNIRPDMPHVRVKLVEKVFDKIDVNSNGIITVDDLRQLYDVTKDTKYKSGELTADEVYEKFLATFDVNSDGTVTREEWLDYYTGVSASIDKDVYFDYMMRQTWKL